MQDENENNSYIDVSFRDPVPDGESQLPFQGLTEIQLVVMV
jgi:hypothetical protein